MTLIPDIKFIKSLKKQSKAPLKQCMQCGNCTVVCELSPDDNPFPRKEMIWASWGQKEKLVGDPDIWLCHQCGDCSTYCPRGVKPGDVLAAVRTESIIHYARPRFLARCISKPWFLIIALAFPMTVILLIQYFIGTLKAPEGPVNYSKFFPHEYLNSTFGLLFLFVFIAGCIGVFNFLRDVKLIYPDRRKSKKSIFTSLIQAKMEILSHKKFRTCNTHKYRYYAHFLVFWGFVMLLFVTLFAILSVIFFEYPIPLWNPIKITGNIASLMLLTGGGIMIWQRLFNKELTGHTSYFDWIFLIGFYLLVITGVLVEIFRFADWHIGYYFYSIHLTLVWFIILYAPYTKFAHMIYRTIALAYSR